jgi:hypothetical protein
MHTTLYRIPTIQQRSPRRTRILAAASGLVAAGSIAVTLAVAGGGSTDTDAGAYPSPTGPSVHAHPDRATLYQRSVETPQPGSVNGERAAERFHHFR